ncbi:pyridoxamine 5'-phosphate oxidase family protein [Desulfospira joergensenii]|uniref:pyridoxamine 5'-phosphate oxidase family protein n=1 Tax=Desulfospira joergensenii TaxID=53329 RepID=UPI0003B53310|nr:pyridoxamine 5'-phosphate oxidase family protein [Desulfospira joergensenii]
MRRREKEIKEGSAIEEIITSSRVFRLAMVDGNRPYVIPLNFGYREGSLYFHSATEGRKIDLLQKNPRVCFEFDILEKLNKNSEACKWGAEFKSVIGEGKAVILDKPEEKRKGLAAIMAQYSNRTFEFSHENLEKTAVIRIDIEKMTGKASG